MHVLGNKAQSTVSVIKKYSIKAALGSNSSSPTLPSNVTKLQERRVACLLVPPTAAC